MQRPDDETQERGPQTAPECPANDKSILKSMGREPCPREHHAAQKHAEQRHGRRQRAGHTHQQACQDQPGQHAPERIHGDEGGHAAEDRAGHRKQAEDAELFAGRPARLDQAAPERRKRSPGQHGLMFINCGKKRHDRGDRGPAPSAGAICSGLTGTECRARNCVRKSNGLPRFRAGRDDGPEERGSRTMSQRPVRIRSTSWPTVGTKPFA